MNTTIIAEIGINHNGDLDVAKKLIDVASFAGCSVVKFQKRNPDVCVPHHQKGFMRDTPWGRMSYIEYKHKIEFGKDEYDEIDNYCKDKKISWTASPWDLDSLYFLTDYDLPFVKIPSALLTDYELIKESSKNFDEIILSTGMSTMEEIDESVKEIDDDCNYALLHCNSTYPAPIEDLNLSCII